MLRLNNAFRGLLHTHNIAGHVVVFGMRGFIFLESTGVFVWVTPHSTVHKNVSSYEGTSEERIRNELIIHEAVMSNS